MAKRLQRQRGDAMCAGVAAGIADYFGVDPVLVRLGFVLLALANGIGILFYLICWVIMPRGEEGVSAPAEPASSGERAAAEVRAAGEQVRAAGERAAHEIREVGESGRGRMIGGSVLIVLGAIFLLDRLPWRLYWPSWLSFGNLWPLLLIAAGIMMLLRAREERA